MFRCHHLCDLNYFSTLLHDNLTSSHPLLFNTTKSIFSLIFIHKFKTKAMIVKISIKKPFGDHFDFVRCSSEYKLQKHVQQLHQRSFPATCNCTDLPYPAIYTTTASLVLSRHFVQLYQSSFPATLYNNCTSVLLPPLAIAPTFIFPPFYTTASIIVLFPPFCTQMHQCCFPAHLTECSPCGCSTSQILFCFVQRNSPSPWDAVLTILKRGRRPRARFQIEVSTKETKAANLSKESNYM